MVTHGAPKCTAAKAAGRLLLPEFVATLPEAIRPILSGSESWHWKRRY